jgi:hypothetical protein
VPFSGRLIVPYSHSSCVRLCLLTLDNIELVIGDGRFLAQAEPSMGAQLWRTLRTVQWLCLLAGLQSDVGHIGSIRFVQKLESCIFACRQTGKCLSCSSRDWSALRAISPFLMQSKKSTHFFLFECLLGGWCLHSCDLLDDSTG